MTIDPYLKAKTDILPKFKFRYKSDTLVIL